MLRASSRRTRIVRPDETTVRRGPHGIRGGRPDRRNELRCRPLQQSRASTVLGRGTAVRDRRRAPSRLRRLEADPAPTRIALPGRRALWLPELRDRLRARVLGTAAGAVGDGGDIRRARAADDVLHGDRAPDGALSLERRGRRDHCRRRGRARVRRSAARDGAAGRARGAVPPGRGRRRIHRLAQGVAACGSDRH